MTRTKTLTTLLAMVMLASVIGTYSIVDAQDDEPRATRRTQRVEPGTVERQERIRRERENTRRREREEQLERDQDERRRHEDPDRREPRHDREPFRPEHIDQFRRMMEMVERTHHTCFNPEMAAMIAIAGLKDEVPRPIENLIGDLEETLTKTKTLGLRNSLRMILRDLYRQRGENDKVLRHLHEMLGENDKALQNEPRPRPE